MREFDNIKDMVYCEIDEISHQGKLDLNTVKVLGELVDILKDIGSVEMFEEGVQISEDGYSNGMPSMRNNGYDGGYSQKRFPIYYDNGNSYRGNGGRGYSRRGRGMMGNGYSRDDAKEHMIQKLENLMNEAQDEKDRESIHRLIEQMEMN